MSAAAICSSVSAGPSGGIRPIGPSLPPTRIRMIADGVGGGHKRRVHEIRAQLVLAAAVFLVTAHAEVLVDLGARRRSASAAPPSAAPPSRRAPAAPANRAWPTHSSRGARSHPFPAASVVSPAGSPGNDDATPGRHRHAAAGRTEPGQATATTTATPRRHRRRAKRRAARRRGPASSAVRCHSGCDASAMTSMRPLHRGHVAALRHGRGQHRHGLGRRR